MSMVALIGEVVSPPELMVTPQGRRLTTMRLRCESVLTGSNDFTCAFWEQDAADVHAVVLEGDRVAVEGRLRHSTWTTADGSKRPRVEVVCHRWRPATPQEASA